MIANTYKYALAERGLYINNNLKRLASFSNLHHGQRCFIIGNGPSLNECDLTLLKDEVTFGVNSIFLNYENMGFYPTYYVVEDPLVAEDRAEEINNYHQSTRFFGNALRYCLDDSSDTVWLNVLYRYQDYEGFPRFSSNAIRRLWVGGTVSYLNMQLAYYMGFRDVYLVGFDHSYAIPADARVEGNQIESASADPNHFHPDYFGKGYRWHDPNVDRMEKSYVRAKSFFEIAGRAIYNATVGGQLEVFKRVNYAELFPGPGG